MRVLSLCTGAGGMDLGFEAAGMETVGMCEIDPHARQVLARRWPDVPVHDNLETFDGSLWNGRVDLVCGGTPCQDLSVAGRRDGLGGERSRLFWDFCRVASSSGAGWVCWENVAGALSANGGADFAAVLWGLTGFYPSVPEDGWGSSGVCVGPDRTASWRVLDARWFGVAQRRRRVFVVAHSRGGCAVEVLFEPESCPRDSGPGGTSGQVASALTANGVGAGGGPDDNAAQAGHLIPAVLGAFDSTWSGRYPMSDQDLSPTLKVGSSLGIPAPPAVAFVPGVESPLLSRDAKGVGVRRLTPLECSLLMGWPADYLEMEKFDDEDSEYAREVLQRLWRSLGAEAVRPTPGGPLSVLTSEVLLAGMYGGWISWSMAERCAASARQIQGSDAWPEGFMCLLREHPQRGQTPPGREPIEQLARESGRPLPFVPYAGAPRLEAVFYRRVFKAAQGSGVLRHALSKVQEVGRPDGSPLADSHRYRMCGNGVVANVTEWIGGRMVDLDGGEK